jgi:hypothetical protein
MREDSLAYEADHAADEDAGADEEGRSTGAYFSAGWFLFSAAL